MAQGKKGNRVIGRDASRAGGPLFSCNGPVLITGSICHFVYKETTKGTLTNSIKYDSDDEQCMHWKSESEFYNPESNN